MEFVSFTTDMRTLSLPVLLYKPRSVSSLASSSTDTVRAFPESRVITPSKDVLSSELLAMRSILTISPTLNDPGRISSSGRDTAGSNASSTNVLPPSPVRMFCITKLTTANPKDASFLGEYASRYDAVRSMSAFCSSSMALRNDSASVLFIS